MEKGINYKVSMQDAVLIGELQIDLVEVLEGLSLKSENTIDDLLVNIIKMAKSGLDWKGYAKEQLAA